MEEKKKTLRHLHTGTLEIFGAGLISTADEAADGARERPSPTIVREFERTAPTVLMDPRRQLVSENTGDRVVLHASCRARQEFLERFPRETAGPGDCVSQRSLARDGTPADFTFVYHDFHAEPWWA